MALRRDKQQEAQQQEQLYEASTSFATDLDDGTPIVVREGEVFRESDEMVKRFGHLFFVEHGTPTWERQRIQQEREAKAGRR